MEGDTNANLFFLDASADMIGIGYATPVSRLDVAHTTGAILTLTRNDTSVTANDLIGQIQFHTNDTQTTTNPYAASIEVYATNTITTDINPGYMVFKTTGTGVAGALTEAMRITAGQLVGINASAPGGMLQITTSADATKGLIIKGYSATQSGNFTEWQNSSGTVLTNVGPTGRVGILTASTTTEGLKVSDTQTVNTGTVNAISGTMAPTPTTATDATYRSGSFITSVGASSDYAFTGSVIGLFGQTQILSTHTTGTISNTYGLSFSASNRSPATATNVYGCSTIVSNRGSGTTTNAY